MDLNRPSQPKALISLVPMIDVMLIMLVFFMVTSTYLNLDMVPVSQQSDPAAAPAAESGDGAGATIFIRLGPDGLAYVRGQPLAGADLSAFLRARLSEEPLTPVVVLPSGRADTQSLVTLMDLATQAGSARLRIIRLEERR